MGKGTNQEVENKSLVMLSRGSRKGLGETRRIPRMDRGVI